ncbi:hypothetical protein CC80DRAFT_314169 [Byssothecium circinans]|uniref:Uncharacterized protein n=1 Tax=Byssothecium circinans TaxID=147558 RepID=A0A6A5U809_9PLEO|nr:hypothetical protein CC80DRAFT_314169 [Byssothecium circinans]
MTAAPSPWRELAFRSMLRRGHGWVLEPRGSRDDVYDDLISTNARHDAHSLITRLHGISRSRDNVRTVGPQRVCHVVGGYWHGRHWPQHSPPHPTLCSCRQRCQLSILQPAAMPHVWLSDCYIASTMQRRPLSDCRTGRTYFVHPMGVDGGSPKSPSPRSWASTRRPQRSRVTVMACNAKSIATGGAIVISRVGVMDVVRSGSENAQTKDGERLDHPTLVYVIALGKPREFWGEK